MKTLHILNKAPDHPRFGRCLDAMGSDDALLLIENAVLALADKGLSLPRTTYALEADLTARALGNADNALDGTTHAIVIDYHEMVKLTAQAIRVISW